MAESSEQDVLFNQMITQSNTQFAVQQSENAARFDQSMRERDQAFAQQMIAIINQTTGSLQLMTTYNMTQAGNITIEKPVNLP